MVKSGQHRQPHSDKNLEMTMQQTAPNDSSLAFACPVCGAEPQEKCEMNNGGIRFESHRQRGKDAETPHLEPNHALLNPDPKDIS